MDVLHDPDQADFAWPTFFRDPDGVSWAEVSIDGALELLPIKSPEFKTLITQRLRASLEHMPSDKLLRDTLREIEGGMSRRWDEESSSPAG